MYNNKDYSEKKRQNRILRKVICVMVAALLAGLILCIGQAKALNEADESSWQYRCKMRKAYETIDSLNREISSLEGQLWTNINLPNE